MLPYQPRRSNAQATRWSGVAAFRAKVHRSRRVEEQGELILPHFIVVLLISLSVTGAFSNIGINPNAGVIYFISRKSVRESAKTLWRQNPPPWRELPALRSSADFAWAFWNRVPHNTHITAFWSLSVNNQQTLRILNLAFKTYKPPPGHRKVDNIQEWPGTDFDIASVEATAILGMCLPLNMMAHAVPPDAQVKLYICDADRIYYRFSKRHSTWLLSCPAQTTAGRKQDDLQNHSLQSSPARYE